MGKNGGLQFLIAYLVFVVILGVPVMITEMSIGQMTEQSPVNAYRKLNKKASFIGFLGILAAFIILSYYSVIGGWILKYIASYVTTLSAPADFAAYTAEPVEPVVWHFVFMLATCLICYLGTKGIEKASSFMMPVLFLILLVIIVRSVTPVSYTHLAALSVQRKWNIAHGDPLSKRPACALKSRRRQKIEMMQFICIIILCFPR